jgi:hypothetical protein
MCPGGSSKSDRGYESDGDYDSDECHHGFEGRIVVRLDWYGLLVQKDGATLIVPRNADAFPRAG